VGSLGTIKNPWWGCWIIDLAPLASLVESVDSITLCHSPSFGVRFHGVEKLCIDDIRLYNTKAPALPDIVTRIEALNDSGATPGQFDMLIAAVTAADGTLWEMLSREKTYTLFAPTNAAFQKARINTGTDGAILKDILRNLIVAENVSATNTGRLKTLEGSTLIQDPNGITDDLGGKAVIQASAAALNGTIHTVDAVLMPYRLAKILDLLKSMNDAGEYAGQFDTLLTGISVAPATVRDTLDQRHHTLFAPTDTACAALGYDPDTIKKLDPSVLSDILLYHIAAGRLMGEDLPATIKTTQGGALKHSNGKLTDATGGQATIIGFDVEGSNGVIHVIDAVLLPGKP
jgi:transforming growth factor-beta-induced protein